MPTERRRLALALAVVAMAQWPVVLVPPARGQEPTPDPPSASQSQFKAGCSPDTLDPCDLAVSAAAPDHALTDDVVTIRVVVANPVDLYRHGVALTVTPPAPGTPITVTTPDIPQNQSVEVSVPFDRDPSWERDLGFVATLPDDEDTANNSTQVTVSFGAPDEGSGTGRLPDVAVAAAEPPSHPDGDFTIVRVRVLNQGPAEASATVTVTPPWSGVPAGRSDVTVAAGGSRVIESRFAVPDSARGTEAVFKVAAARLRGEKDTDDNSADIPVVIAALVPDLAVGRPRLEQQASATADVVATVRNVGAATSEATTARARGTGKRSRAVSVPALDPGESAEVRVPVAIPPGRRGERVRLTVTVASVAAETVLANNTADGLVRTLAAGEVAPAAGPDGGPPWWPLGLAVLAAALLAAWLLRRRLRGQGASGQLAPPIEGERAVVTGFASLDDPGTLLDPGEPLTAGRAYHFCLEIGPPVAREEWTDPTVQLDAVVFPLEGDVGLRRDADRGVLELVPRGGAARVARQPSPVAAPDDVARRRLLFPVRPQGAGGELRCSLFARGVLVWSQRVAVPTTAAGGARQATVDFGIAPTLAPRHLARLPRHNLSMLLNHTAEGTHVLTIAADGEFHPALVLDPLHLQQMLDELRGALRMAAWGSNSEWSENLAYRYESSDPEQLRLDLARLAVRSARFYTYLKQRLADAGWNWRDLRERMRRQGVVQLAIKESPTHLLPTALIYDQPLDDTYSDFSPYRLCPAFTAARRESEPLERTACFAGDCPHWEEETTVCPSGFWGFRHDLGATVSGRAAGQGDIVEEIGVHAHPELVMAVSTDERFEGRAAHEAAVRRLCEGGWYHAANRQDALALLSEGRAHVVYFYCHGGVQNDNPTLQIGAGPGSLLTPTYLTEHGPTWTDPRPLVILNGCRTTAVEPRNALNFVSIWLSMLRASGVVGTDITVFEPLASAFAERCLARFLAGEPLGRAVRLARLGLLQEGNPLALTYVPFALAGLHLAKPQGERVTVWAGTSA